MTTKGPLGIIPRPLAKEQFTVTVTEEEVNAQASVTGPLGTERPLARPNPPQTIDEEEFIQACQQSEWATDLVDGLDRYVGGGISEQRKQEIIESNCDNLSQGIEFPISEQFRSRVLGD